jgi:hypothetical protein
LRSGPACAAISRRDHRGIEIQVAHEIQNAA